MADDPTAPGGEPDADEADADHPDDGAADADEADAAEGDPPVGEGDPAADEGDVEASADEGSGGSGEASPRDDVEAGDEGSSGDELDAGDEESGDAEVESGDEESGDAEVEVGDELSGEDDVDGEDGESPAEAERAEGDGDSPAAAERPEGDGPPSEADDDGAPGDGPSPEADEGGVPADVRKYERFKKVDGAQYERVNDFLRERTYITAREWAIARLCADFRTETGVEMTKIGENLDELVPFMEDTYSPQAVNQARSSFEEKVHKAGATFLYGAMSDFFTAEELDELMYEVTEVAKFLLEVEGVDLAVEDELEAEDRISGVMREVRAASEALRHPGTECPECGHEFGGDD